MRGQGGRAPAPISLDKVNLHRPIGRDVMDRIGMGAQAATAGQGRAGRRVVEAEIAYLETGAIDPVWCSHDDSRTYLPLNPVVMPIEDGRGAPGAFSLDREGLMLADAPTAVRDFLDLQTAGPRYRAELEEAVKAATGARKVVISPGWVHRRSEKHARFGEAGATYPGRQAHIDYSDNSGPISARQMLGEDPDAEALMAGRFAIFNLWRALSPPPQDTPLCVCDATTVAAEDLVPAHIILGMSAEREFKLETNQVQHNPAHRWVYFSNMTRDELLIFRGYDSDPARFRRVPHVAFDDPTFGEAAIPRESIDIRCAAFFG